MTGWIFLLVIVALLILISQIRLGGRVVYEEGEIRAILIVGPLRLQMYPKQSENSRKQKKEKTSAKAHERKETPKGGTVERFMELLPTVVEAVQALKRRIRIDRLKLSVIWGADDPAAAAIGYGRANAVLGMIWPLLDNNFKVKKCDFKADVDYGRTEPELTADAAITMTFGQLISFVVLYGVKLFRSGKRSEKKQEAECNE